MKLHAITFAAALFAAHLATAQVEQPMVGTVTDTVSSTVILGSDVATQAQQEAALKAEKEQLKAQQQAQKEQEKALKAEEKALKEKAKAEEVVAKAETVAAAAGAAVAEKASELKEKAETETDKKIKEIKAKKQVKDNAKAENAGKNNSALFVGVAVVLILLVLASFFALLPRNTKVNLERQL